MPFPVGNECTALLYFSRADLRDNNLLRDVSMRKKASFAGFVKDYIVNTVILVTESDTWKSQLDSEV